MFTFLYLFYLNHVHALPSQTIKFNLKKKRKKKALKNFFWFLNKNFLNVGNTCFKDCFLSCLVHTSIPNILYDLSHLF